MNGHARRNAAPSARDNQILTDAQIGKLIRAARDIDAAQKWDGDLYRLVSCWRRPALGFLKWPGCAFLMCSAHGAASWCRLAARAEGSKGAGATPVAVGKDVLDALLARRDGPCR